MTVHIARCRMCRRCFNPERSRRSGVIRAILIGLPIAVGGAAAALERPDFLLVGGLGLVLGLLGSVLLREPCPHCHSLRTRYARIPYLTIVR